LIVVFICFASAACGAGKDDYDAVLAENQRLSEALERYGSMERDMDALEQSLALAEGERDAAKNDASEKDAEIKRLNDELAAANATIEGLMESGG
jgi:peptidoglycan hydrolase CwlO-like protein